MCALKYEINCNFYDSMGNTVLNDEKLLEIVQNYPVLYDSRQKTFGTKEYDEWVWTDIAHKINFSYGSVIQDFPFSGKEVFLRWQTLVNTLRKMYQTCDAQIWEIFSNSTKQSIIFFKRYFDEESSETNSLLTPAFPEDNPAIRLLRENANLMDELSLELGRKLESDILDLILETELNCVASVKPYNIQESKISEEVTCFLSSINFKTDSTPTKLTSVPNNSISLFDEESADDPAPISENRRPEPSIINEPIDDNDFAADTSVIQIDEDDPLDDEPLLELLKRKNTEDDELSDEPIAYCRQVPLGFAKFFIRPCVVRLERIKYIEPKRRNIKQELFY